MNLCARCRKAPRLGGGVYCPWCQYGPQPHLWPQAVRYTVELQGGFDLAPGALPPHDVAANPQERRAQDSVNPFGYRERERVLRTHGSGEAEVMADHVAEAAERVFATPGPWEPSC